MNKVIAFLLAIILFIPLFVSPVGVNASAESITDTTESQGLTPEIAEMAPYLAALERFAANTNYQSLKAKAEELYQEITGEITAGTLDSTKAKSYKDEIISLVDPEGKRVAFIDSFATNPSALNCLYTFDASNSVTAGAHGFVYGQSNIASANYSYVASSSNRLFLYNSQNSVFSFVNEDGNYVIRRGEGNSTKASYFALQLGDTSLYNGKPFVIEFSAKVGASITNSALLDIYTGSTKTALVVVAPDGKIRPSGTSAHLGTISNSEYSRISVFVDVPNNLFYLYLDGVLLNPDGQTLFTDTNSNYQLTEVRFFQNYVQNTEMYFDNLSVYYTDSFDGGINTKMWYEGTGIAFDGTGYFYGDAKEEWVEFKDGARYFDADGYMQIGEKTIDGQTFVFDSLGISNVGCKLTDKDGKTILMYTGTEFSKELVTLAEENECSIVFLKDMTTPSGTSSSVRYEITAHTLNIDLNDHTLNLSAFARFISDKDTRLSIKNGTVSIAYGVYQSYQGGADTSFYGENVRFVASTSYAMFDHRMGGLTLNNCELAYTYIGTNTTNFFTLADTTRANPVSLDLVGCTFTALGSPANAFSLTNGQPVTLSAKNCVFNLGAKSLVVLAKDTRGKNAGDRITLDGCEIDTASNEKLFDISYATVAIEIGETYVKNGASYTTENGTVTLANGQTQATVLGGGYMVTAPKVSISSNLTLYVDFALNIWLPANTNIETITVLGEIYNISDLTLDEEGRYCIALDGISAISAADDISILITYTDGDKTLTVEKLYSVIKYARSLLSSDKYSAQSRALVASVVNYIYTAYTYIDKELGTELAALLDSEAYKSATELDCYDILDTVPETETDIGTATGAISGARLYLDKVVEFIFILNPSYTGTLTLEYASGTYTYEVVNGVTKGNGYITVNMRAFALYGEKINITAGEYQGSYDLAAYIYGMRSEYENTENLESLLLGLYNYCKEAKEYKEYIRLSGENN